MRKKKRKPDKDKTIRTDQKMDKEPAKGNLKEEKVKNQKRPQQKRRAGTKGMEIMGTITLLVLIAFNLNTTISPNRLNNNNNSENYKQSNELREPSHEQDIAQKTTRSQDAWRSRTIKYPRLGERDEQSTRCCKNSEDTFGILAQINQIAQKQIPPRKRAENEETKVCGCSRERICLTAQNPKT